jgi:hypothetical protein
VLWLNSSTPSERLEIEAQYLLEGGVNRRIFDTVENLDQRLQQLLNVQLGEWCLTPVSWEGGVNRRISDTVENSDQRLQQLPNVQCEESGV